MARFLKTRNLSQSLIWLYWNYRSKGLYWSIRYKRIFFLLIINCGLCFILCYLHSWAFGLLVSFAGFRACLIYICLTVYEFSFILLIHHIILLILISVLSVTFWTLTYYKIYFFWSRTVWYETIELFILWHVWKCFGVLWVNSYQLAVHSRESCMIEQALLPHWLCNQKHPSGHM